MLLIFIFRENIYKCVKPNYFCYITDINAINVLFILDLQEMDKQNVSFNALSVLFVHLTNYSPQH